MAKDRTDKKDKKGDKRKKDDEASAAPVLAQSPAVADAATAPAGANPGGGNGVATDAAPNGKPAKNGKSFNLDDPALPKSVAEKALSSGGYPYDKTMPDGDYETAIEALQIELVKLQQWTIAAGERIVIVFEGRDAAGKGGTIGAFREYMSPRRTRVVALPKPTETEAGQWYFQRYAVHMPTRGEIVMFDRSWYNRAGVERVMNFCTPEQTEQFLKEAPRFEDMLIDEGLHLVKFFIDVGYEMQLKRFHERRHNPLKVWKVSPIDYAAIEKYADYTRARDRMLETTHTDHAPWMLLLGNDKKRLRLNALRHLLGLFDYPGKNRTVIGDIDPKILGREPGFLTGRA
ncbi:polyphosphate kinase 2 [Prosthecodimorpha staleyi]|uniref:ADP/GDP-polyphosphate phosphotransferase n=1 Tax=Prosthecodimorpha staleyi TaxID=2840188 RepID=A0A947GJP5_9HYPH|nr:polyphosphate kinase 2 [Prosthecodimorpha staleyi]MBT9292084.1 polyphosphate kinase 2 [Prosthecodimorpha staleyi]